MYASEYTSDTLERPSLGAGAATKGPPEPAPVVEIVTPGPTAWVDAIEPRDVTLLALVELLLKDRWRLYRLIRVPAASAALLPRLLAIALAGFVLFGVAM